MLGWNVSVYRVASRRTSPAHARSRTAERIAVWQCGVGSLDWLDELARSGRAVDLGGDGYPLRYTAPAKEVVPVVLAGPPGARAHWSHDPGDVLGPGWAGTTVIDRHVAEDCRGDEWLLIEAWDES